MAMTRKYDIRDHPSYIYAVQVIKGEINAPKFVKKQARLWKKIADDKDKKYIVNAKMVAMVDHLLKMMIMPDGAAVGKTIYNALVGYQWFFLIATLCTVYRDKPTRRRYRNCVLEICRRNGKSTLIAIIFIVLMICEGNYTEVFSVAPDGSLSRISFDIVKKIIASSPKLRGLFTPHRDDIKYNKKNNVFKPLCLSSNRLDGRKVCAFISDETGALPDGYAINAMRSGGTNEVNHIGYIISTKYPKIDNPFEKEVEYAKNVLNGSVNDESLFALLYEPDKKDWETNVSVLEQGNPLALTSDALMEQLKSDREKALARVDERQNFLTKHCNIMYSGLGTDTYIPVEDLQKCRVNSLDWTGLNVYLGVDLSMTTDNCAVAMVARNGEKIQAGAMTFVPEGRIETKNKAEKINYYSFIDDGHCIACGDMVISYNVVEQYIRNIEDKYGCKVAGIGFDRSYGMEMMQSLDEDGFVVAQIEQNVSHLCVPVQKLKEAVYEQTLEYEKNELFEINFQNAKSRFDGGMREFVDKKHSAGRIDIVDAILNAFYMLNNSEDSIITWGSIRL